jgi:hypothetical protein
MYHSNHKVVAFGRSVAYDLNIMHEIPVTEGKYPGIFAIRNRVEQALVKLALEPEWEARFEANSYGFRPGCSAHDAIEAIFNATCHKAKYIPDADIALLSPLLAALFPITAGVRITVREAITEALFEFLAVRFIIGLCPPQF